MINFTARSFNKAIQDAINAYDDLLKENEMLQEKLNNFNKDEEIQKAKDLVEYTRKHSLLQLSDKEVNREKAFRTKHYEKHILKIDGEPMPMKINGNTYIYELTGTGLGIIIKITCPICGESEDITDTESW